MARLAADSGATRDRARVALAGERDGLLLLASEVAGVITTGSLAFILVLAGLVLLLCGYHLSESRWRFRSPISSS
jgi:hypothetical protein